MAEKGIRGVQVGIGTAESAEDILSGEHEIIIFSPEKLLKWRVVLQSSVLQKHLRSWVHCG